MLPIHFVRYASAVEHRFWLQMVDAHGILVEYLIPMLLWDDFLREGDVVPEIGKRPVRAEHEAVVEVEVFEPALEALDVEMLLLAESPKIRDLAL